MIKLYRKHDQLIIPTNVEQRKMHPFAQDLKQYAEIRK